MMKFKDLKIGTRLNIGLGTLLLVIGGMAASGVSQLSNIGIAIETLAHESLQKERIASQWYANTLANSVRGYAAVKIQNPDDLKRLKEDMAATTKAIDATQKEMMELASTPEEKAAMEKVLAARKTYTANRKLAMELAAANNVEQAHDAIENKMMPALHAYVASIQAVQTLAKQDIDQRSDAIDAMYIGGRHMLIGLGIIGMLIGALLAWRLARGITAPVNKAVEVARTVASGDLTMRIEVLSKDETGVLMHSLQDMNQNLFNTVTTVREGTDSIHTAASQIAEGNNDLASRTAAQAAALEETSAAIEHLTDAVRKNADSAQEANRLAGQAAHVAHQGGTVVEEVVDVMKAIEQSSKKIVDIISVIDGIAFQTNILALNAAVEAARAGEQGRGFAVVASEVRSLAQRSATAAKEIEGLIQESVTKVANGTKLVSAAGATMTDIVTSIDQVTLIMTEIAQASREQTDGIEQVKDAVVSMDDMTQQNSALVEEAAAAAQEMQSQASMLRQVVSSFKV